MSELIDNARRRKDLLKHMILELHAGRAPEAVRPQLIRLLGEVPYGDVVEVEQEILAEGLPVEEVLKLCDVHAAALQGAISQKGARTAPPGHPVHTFQQENRALEWEIESLESLFATASAAAQGEGAGDLVSLIRERFNHLMDVEKHYLRKEHLLFPFLEKHGITGPPTVMWGKHDETRQLLRTAMDALVSASGSVTAGEVAILIPSALRPAVEGISGMIDKEERILFPMCLDTLSDSEWLEIARGSAEIGFCLIDPSDDWTPEGQEPATAPADGGERTRVQLPSGSMTPEELIAILNTIPFDLTFVDRDDTVRYFTQGRERIFARTRAILGRKVQYCHPPSSVDVVDQILDAFKAGRRDRAAFWIEMGGRFLSIEYFALRGGGGEYLGCLEVSQDLTAKRALTGERRLLAWEKEDGDEPREAAAVAELRDSAADEERTAERPSWYRPPSRSFDARPVIAGGGHPLERVMRELAEMEPGGVYELITPFVPAPLLDVARDKGYLVWTAPAVGGEVRSYLARPPEES